MKIKIPKNELLYCKYCDITFSTGTQRNRHFKEAHQKNYNEYILDIYLDNVEPVCKCGCGTKTKFGVLYNNIIIPEYTKNHAPRKPHTNETKLQIRESLQKTMLSKYGVTNPMHLKIFKDKILEVKKEKYGDENYNNMEKSRQTKIEKYGDANYNNIEKRGQTFIEKYNGYTLSSPELMEKVKLTKMSRYGDPYFNNPDKNRQTKIDRYGTDKIRLNSIKHSKYEKIIAEQINGEHKFLYHGKEFDIRKDNYLIEIDGDYYHPIKAENLTITQLNNFINDYEKYKIVQEYNEFTLIKIHVSQLDEIETLESLIQKSYIPDYHISLNQKIITKEYLQKFIHSKGKDGLEKYITVFVKFVQTFSPDIIEFLKFSDRVKMEKITVPKILTESNKFYYTRYNNSGSKFLKSIFLSYFKSRYSRMNNLESAWKDLDTLIRIIKYRIGINSTNEVFDFSIKNILRGYQVNRYTISWFKPTLAAGIYKYFLKDNPCPTVFDPCAGFGGRMLGFYSVYPNGTYIGVEPNLETYNELIELNEILGKKSILINDKIENVDLSQFKYDLAFTSIPYWNTEIYSEDHTKNYIDYNDWKNVFLSKIKSIDNLIVNIPESLIDEFECNTEYKLIHNKSNFNKKGTKTKFEYILDMR